MKKQIIFAYLVFFSLSFAFAQTNNPSTGNNNAVTKTPLTYTCSMHPEIKSDKPGICPVCNMELVVKATPQYTCSMHPEVVSSTPGKCPKCGMALELKSAPYSCPMHPEVTSMTPGNCPKCGMKLQKGENKSHKHSGHNGCSM
jgi:ssDNA-binding Zn-finger/Zn-ribbon topoisomerase 1